VTLPKDIHLNAPARLGCDLSGTTEAMNIKNIQFNMSPLQLTGDGAYKSTGKSSSYVFDIKSNAFSLEEVSKMVPSIQEYQLVGKSSVTAKVASAPQGPDVKGTAQLQGVSANLQQAKLVNIVSAIDFTMRDAAGKLTADELKHEYFYGKKTGC